MNPLRPRTPQYTYSLSRYVARATSENLGARWPPASSRWICHTCRGRDSVPRREARSTVSASKHRDNAFRELASCNAGRRSFLTTSSNKEQSQTGHAQSSPSSLPSQAENRRSDLSKRLTSLMDHMQSNIFIAGQRLNDLTGYSGIETLKKDIENQEKSLTEARNELQEAKQQYSAAISQRSASQREVNELLQRKNNWSTQDLERFTSLYRSDHANEQAESSAQEAVAAAERAAEEASAKLSASILARYHEEQIWSDKIRRMSTWGTWGLMGVNVLLFLVFQIGVEPWRRRRLVKGFEDKVVEALEKEGIASNVAIAALQEAQISRMDSVSAANEKSNSGLLEASSTLVLPDSIESIAERKVQEVEVVDVSTKYSGLRRILESCKAFISDLFSYRDMSVRRIDLTTAALEGTFVGIAITAVISALLRA